ncbi:MAG: hypothetical protein EPO40_12945 [Myxococcaceae bacterium]|nr:MAG: hypothetical protein EPO40_12945 [Myxococcaceae bacterium]
MTALKAARKPAVRAAKAQSPSRSARARPRPRLSPAAPADSAGRRVIPEIIVGFDEEAVADEGIAALAACPELFVHDAQLVTLVPRAHPGLALARAMPTLRIEPLPSPRLRELLSRSARWLVPQSGDDAQHVVSHVPKWVVSGIASRRHWPGLRPLTAVVTAPVLRPDGTILATPGYDEATGLYLAPREALPTFDDSPTMADARDAAETLLASVEHVPFAAPADQAAWLAMVLTPLARFAVAAGLPLCVVEDSPRSRWSDDVITDIANLVVAGPPVAIDADDLVPSPRRSIDALRENGESIARITNGAARPAVVWRRIHEVLERTRATNGFVWFASTTRAMRDAELNRFALITRCEGGRMTEHDGDAFIRDRTTSDLLVAGLTILRAYQVAGRPPVRLTRWAGFERWSGVVRAAVVWCGLPDPVTSLGQTPEPTNATDAAAADLVVGWSELAAAFPGGATARQALDALEQAPRDRYARLRAAVTVFAPGPLDEQGTATRLGRSLRRHRHEVHEGLSLVLAGSGNQGNRWAVRASSPTSPA